MGFFDDVNKALGQFFNPSKPNPIGGDGYISGSQGGGFSPDNRGLGEPVAPERSPFSQDAERIQSIAQVNERPFNVVDIDCYNLPASDYACLYPQSTIDNLVGAEPDREYSNATSDGAGETNQARYWRTVQIPFFGNFLKIEFLPNRINQQDGLSNGNIGPSNVDLSYNVNGTFNEAYFTTSGGNIYPDASIAQGLQGRKICLVSFDSQQQVPLVAEHGTIFKCGFNQAFITVRSGMGRIRVTAGYNTEITKDPNDKAANSILHMSTAQGFLERPLLHFEPFYAGANDAASVDVNKVIAATTTQTLIVVNSAVNVNQGVAFTKKGVATIWITNIDFMYMAGANNEESFWTLGLGITDQSGGLRRLIKMMRIRSIPIAYGAGTFGRDFGTKTWNFTTPLRISLHEDEKLVFNIYNGAPVEYVYNYEIHGYVYGRWCFTSTGANGNQRPIALRDYSNEHPYMLDNFRTVAEDLQAAQVSI